MEILWLAIILYSVGLGLVLHFRPSLMFQENGAWKEFGYQRSSRHTLFPFWLFAITWAFLSYAIATSVSLILPAAAVVAAMPTQVVVEAEEEEEEEAEEAEAEAEAEAEEAAQDEEITPISKAKAKPRTGYYVLDKAASKNSFNKYIYYGPDKPE
jgi:hypothetical protein